MKTTLLALLLLALPAAAQAHELWIERDGTGPARLYLGEPAEPLPVGGDPEFAKLKVPNILSAPRAVPARKAGYLEVAVPVGDVRAWDDNVFAPWISEGKREGVIYYARAGRGETRALMPFEIVPVAAGSDRFVVMRDGKPLAGTGIVVVTPDRWSRTLTSDAAGAITLPVRERGRYLLTATVREDGARVLPGGAVDAVHHTTTISFVAG